MRDVLLDILNHTHDITGFELLKIYHKKQIVTEIIPDQFGKVTGVDNITNQFQSTRENIPWLKLGMPINFSIVDSTFNNATNQADSSTTFLTDTRIDTTQTYYITNIVENTKCLRFTVGMTAAPEDVVLFPAIDFEFFVVNPRSYFVVADSSTFKVGDPILFESLPDSSTAVIQSELQFLTRYYIKDIIDSTKIRVTSVLNGDFIRFDTALNNNFEMVIDKSFVEAVSEDQIVYVVAETKQKIRDLNGEFALDKLDKLHNIVQNTDEYFPTGHGPIIQATNTDTNNEFVTTKLNISNADGTFKDEYVISDKSILQTGHPMIDFKGSLWNFQFTPSTTSIQRFDDMAKTYNEFLYYDVSTSSISFRNDNYPALPHYQLDLKFGEANPYFGNVIFEPQIYGTYIPQIIYKYKSTIRKVTADYRGLITKMNKTVEQIVVNVNDALDILTINDTSVLNVNDPVTFANPDDSSTALVNVNLDVTKTYYIKEIIDCTRFKVSEAVNGSAIDFPEADWTFILEREVNMFEMTYSMPNNEDSVNKFYYDSAEDSAGPIQIDSEDSSYDTTMQNKRYWLRVGLPIQFNPQQDSAGALAQYGIDYTKTYYVKEIFNTLKSPDSAMTPMISRFSISETVDGAAFQIPFNFDHEQPDSTKPQMDDFYCYTEVNEFEIDDTRFFEVNDPVKIVGFPVDDSVNSPLQIDIDPNILYYIKEIKDSKRFTISSTIDGEEFKITKSALIDFNIMIVRENNNSILFTSHPSLNADPTKENVLTTVYGSDYPVIKNVSTTDFNYGNRQSLIPVEPSMFGPLKIGDTLSDSTDKLHDDSTIPIPRDPSGNTTLDGQYVYAFEYLTKTLEDNFAYDTNQAGDEVKIYDTVQKGYLMPVGFLRQSWTYYVPQTLAILTLNDTKTMRFSDQGKMMITLDNSYATYNYIMPAKL